MPFVFSPKVVLMCYHWVVLLCNIHPFEFCCVIHIDSTVIVSVCTSPNLYAKTHRGQNSFRILLKLEWQPLADYNCGFLSQLIFNKNRPSRCIQSAGIFQRQRSLLCLLLAFLSFGIVAIIEAVLVLAELLFHGVTLCKNILI